MKEEYEMMNGAIALVLACGLCASAFGEHAGQKSRSSAPSSARMTEDRPSSAEFAEFRDKLMGEKELLEAATPKQKIRLKAVLQNWTSKFNGTLDLNAKDQTTQESAAYFSGGRFSTGGISPLQMNEQLRCL